MNITDDGRLIAAAVICEGMKKRSRTTPGQDRHEAWLELADLEAAAPQATVKVQPTAPLPEPRKLTMGEMGEWRIKDTPIYSDYQHFYDLGFREALASVAQRAKGGG